MAQQKKRKRFFEIEIPLINKETQLSAYEPKELDNRLIIYDLTRILKGKNMLLKLKTKTEDNKLISVPVEIKLLPYYLKRIVRKGTDYVEDSFSAECENSQIRLKPFLVTRRKVTRAVRKELRNKAKEELIDYSKAKKSDEIFDDIIKNKLQKQLSLKLKKIYPLSACEIRILKVEKFKK
jgi:ribosomal protein S3AE